ncbi:acyltransferase family protein [Phocaeicola plebeius]|jgi:peptidoglycan/LPS O-acetylase OafA/YrhL|uniref:acyltransferase family protein n=1 Tax=Phocaeicola plebeius TaxID=310297 RepID=UPI0026ECD12E|nr:acyltransferase family protein [Phocaeicola plebeius]
MKIQEILNKEQSLKGQLLCILLVLFHHWAQKSNLNNIEFLSFLKYIGGCACCGFFFLSGYGIYKSYLKDPIVWRSSFIKKRFVKVLFPFFIICSLYYLVHIFATHSNFDITTCLLSILGIDISANGHFWFMQFLILLYIGIYIISYITNNNKLQLLYITIWNLLCIILVGKNMGATSSLGFALGICCSIYIKIVSRIMQNKLFFIGCLLIFIVSFVLQAKFEEGFKISYFVNLITFLPLLIYTSQKLVINRYIKMLQPYSYYLYLTNAFSIQIYIRLEHKLGILLSLILYLLLNITIAIIAKESISKTSFIK